MRIAFLLAAMVASPAIANECNVFALEFDPDITITDNMQTVTINDAGEVTTYEVGLTKLRGQIISVGIGKPGDDNLEHFFQYVMMDGKKRMIYDSQVFIPACSVVE